MGERHGAWSPRHVVRQRSHRTFTGRARAVNSLRGQSQRRSRWFFMKVLGHFRYLPSVRSDLASARPGPCLGVARRPAEFASALNADAFPRRAGATASAMKYEEIGPHQIALAGIDRGGVRQLAPPRGEHRPSARPGLRGRRAVVGSDLPPRSTTSCGAARPAPCRAPVSHHQR